MESLTVATAAAAVRAGGRSLVASSGGRLGGELAAGGGELVRLPVHARDPIHSLINAFHLATVMRREGVSLAHVRSRAPAFSVLAAAWMAGGVPVVASYHGAYGARGPVKRWYNRVMTRGAAVIANSQFTAAHIRAEHPRAAGRIAVIPEGIDTAAFDPAAVSGERVAAARAAFGLEARDAGRRVVLVAARLTALKGHALLIDAAARSPRREEMVLVFAGAGPLAAKLGAQASAAGVALRHSGPLADMPAAYLAADIVAAPSTAPETFGRSVAEAMAMARVALASDVGGQAETAAEGARLVRAGDVAAWKVALEAALAMSEAECAALGAAARARIVERFSLEAMCAATFALYRRLVGR